MTPQKRSFYLSWAIGLLFTLSGLVFLLLGQSFYGVALFCVLPVALGLTSGILPDRRWAFYGLILTLAIFFILVLAGGVEGMVCVLMAMPIVIPLIFLGYLIAELIRKLSRKKPEDKSFNISLLYPFLVFLGMGFLELVMGNEQVQEATSTTLLVADSPAEVYRKIIHVDTVNVETNWLHNLGLPIPRKCTLTEEKVGGKRICVFEEGEIIETITELRPNELLRMNVAPSSMLGMHWLRFDEDIYSIKAVANGTEITRTTTYFSELKPRFYWKLIENLTIGSEQTFVFQNLKKDLAHD